MSGASIHSADFSARLAGVALVLLVAFLALSRAAVQILVPEGGATAVARLQIGGMELAFIAAVLADARVRIPSLKSLRPAPFWLLLLWFVWSGTAVMAADIPVVALVRQTEWVIHGLFAWCLWSFLAAYPDWRAVLPRYFVWGFLFYGIAATVFLSNVPNPDDFPWLGGLIGFRNVRHFSTYAALAVVAAHLPLMRAAAVGPGETRRTFILLTVLWAFVMWSGSRGAILAILVALGGMSLLRLIPEPKRLWRMTGLAALLGLCISLPFIPPHPAFGVLRLATSVQEAETINDLSSDRAVIWADAAGKIAENPVYGIGPDHYAMATEKAAPWNMEHPHNLVLQGALEWGIPGAMAFLAGMALLLGSGIRNIRLYGGVERRIGLALAVAVLAHSFVSGTLYYGLPIVVLALAFALALVPGEAGQGPFPENDRRQRFDVDIHGLTALAGVVMAVYAASVAAILIPGTPAPDDWRARLTTSFPAAMTIEEAGEHLDVWAADWREDGRLSGYDWLNWTAEHSRTPWTSLETMGTWLIEDGYPGEGRRLQKRAAALRPETESP